MKTNGLTGGAYIEPFAGGAGIAWALLFDGIISSVHLNDLDLAIYAFWRSVLDHTEELCRAIRQTRVTIYNWKKQKAVLQDPSNHSLLEIGFAAFFLNRTNRSGIIRGGVIGGQGQQEKWKLNARYNKHDLIARIQKIAEYSPLIQIYNLDAADFILAVLPTLPSQSLVFLDPPYCHRGHDLYYNQYHLQDHKQLAGLIIKSIDQPWIVSYDNVAEVRGLYANFIQKNYCLSYSAADRYVGSELLIFSSGLRLPAKALPTSEVSSISLFR
jgi:DNA adenine methylase